MRRSVLRGVLAGMVLAGLGGGVVAGEAAGAGAAMPGPGAAAAVAVADAAPPEPVLRFDGQVRYRGLADARDFDGGTDPLQYGELRTRLGLLAVPQPGLQLYVQLQDSRVLGANSGGVGPGADDDGVGLHQGYLLYAPASGLGLQAGRFTMAYGNERLVGNVDWDNVGRTWDGVRGLYEGEGVRADLFLVKRSESLLARQALDEFGETFGDEDRDHDFIGLNWRLKPQALDLFVYADLDDAPRYTLADTGLVEIEAERDDTRVTFGTSAARELGGGFDALLDLAFQVGQSEMRTRPADAATERDIAAWLFVAEVGRTFAGAAGLRVAVLLDYASGDDDPLDGDLHAFDNLYYTGHKWRGYMDYFVSSRTTGLIDLALRLRARPLPGWTLRLDAHHFAAAADYPVPAGGEARQLGQEIDLVGVFQDGRFSLEAGASAFFATEEAGGYAAALSGPDETATWGYVIFVAGF